MRARGAADFRFASALNANIFLPLFYFGGAFRSHSVFSPPNGNFKSITTCLHVEALKGALKPSIPNNCNLKVVPHKIHNTRQFPLHNSLDNFGWLRIIRRSR